ncbi:MAG: hypothetical protein AB8G86_06140, partial [Saprospiraceae bacterium]
TKNILMNHSKLVMPNDKVSKIISLAFLAFILLNFPIIGLLGKGIFILGFPLLYLYIFVVWLGLIITLAIILRKRNIEN